MSYIYISGPVERLRTRLLLGRDRRKILQILFDNGGSLDLVELRLSVASASGRQKRLEKQFSTAIAQLAKTGYVVVNGMTISLADPAALLRFDLDEGRIKAANARSWVAIGASVVTIVITLLK